MRTRRRVRRLGAGLRPAAKEVGISRTLYERAFRGVTPDPEVLEKANRQPNSSSRRGSISRLRRPRSASPTRATCSGSIARTRPNRGGFRVERHILVAISGWNSSCGEALDKDRIVKSVVRSLATVAYADPRRARFARQQLIAALKIVEYGDVTSPA